MLLDGPLCWITSPMPSLPFRAMEMTSCKHISVFLKQESEWDTHRVSLSLHPPPPISQKFCQALIVGPKHLMDSSVGSQVIACTFHPSMTPPRLLEFCYRC
eukprot:jgi/Botrbrau1/9603/Bobra.106_2s0025.2